MLYLSIYLQCSADSAAYYISYFYSLFTCRVWFYPESRLLNKKFSLKKDKDHQLVKGNMGLEENLETKRNIWINPTGLWLALLGYIFIALSRDSLLAHICHLWSDGHMAINGHLAIFGHMAIGPYAKQIGATIRKVECTRLLWIIEYYFGWLQRGWKIT